MFESCLVKPSRVNKNLVVLNKICQSNIIVDSTINLTRLDFKFEIFRINLQNGIKFY
jgi:hypothetical protein